MSVLRDAGDAGKGDMKGRRGGFKGMLHYLGNIHVSSTVCRQGGLEGQTRGR